MKREKQIIKEAERLIDPYEMFIDWEYERGLKEGFVKGANWADEHPKSDIVNKQELIEKLKVWLKINTNWDMEYDECGRNDDYGKIDELVKYLEG